MRAVPEWIAKHDDQAIPQSVRVRVFDRFEGKCALTGKKLYPGEYDLDHIISLKRGGQHRESNLHPVWRPKHREKTAQENSEDAKVERIRDKHFGHSKDRKKKGREWPKRKMDGTVERRSVPVVGRLS